MAEEKKIAILAAVAEGMANLAENTRNRVVEHFADLEATKRANALIAGLDKLNALSKDRAKLNKPDVVTYNEDGSEASGAYSKERIDARRKLDEQIEKLTKALDKADDKADYSDLYNLAKGN